MEKHRELDKTLQHSRPMARFSSAQRLLLLITAPKIRLRHAMVPFPKHSHEIQILALRPIRRPPSRQRSPRLRPQRCKRNPPDTIPFPPKLTLLPSAGPIRQHPPPHPLGRITPPPPRKRAQAPHRHRLRVRQCEPAWPRIRKPLLGMVLRLPRRDGAVRVPHGPVPDHRRAGKVFEGIRDAPASIVGEFGAEHAVFGGEGVSKG